MNMINISLFKFGTKALEIVIIDNAPWFISLQKPKYLLTLFTVFTDGIMSSFEKKLAETLLKTGLETKI